MESEPIKAILINKNCRNFNNNIDLYGGKFIILYDNTPDNEVIFKKDESEKIENDPLKQFNLGVLYQIGNEEIKKDMKQALFW
jgi:TPR repeat protein